MAYDHIAEAVKEPAIVRLSDNLFVARFEVMKLYSALEAVRTLLARGVVSPGDTVVDSSSGIYAYSLAMACHRYGLKCHIIASKTVDRTLRTQLDILGATVEPVKKCESLKLDQEQRVKRIQELLSERSDLHWMQQYHDDIHYLGYEAFAQKILHELRLCDVRTDLGITAVGGVGSGCSTGGLKTYLEAAGVETKLVGIQPFGSMTFGAEHVEDPEIIIAGIGSSIPFRNVKHDNYSEISWISFDYAMSATIELLRKHAIFAGLSSGAGYLVANWMAKQEPEKPHIFIAADTGHRYVDAVFAQHEKALPFETLTPTEITHQNQLALHWSNMKLSQAA